MGIDVFSLKYGMFLVPAGRMLVLPSANRAYRGRVERVAVTLLPIGELISSLDFDQLDDALIPLGLCPRGPLDTVTGWSTACAGQAQRPARSELWLAGFRFFGAQPIQFELGCGLEELAEG